MFEKNFCFISQKICFISKKICFISLDFTFSVVEYILKNICLKILFSMLLLFVVMLPIVEESQIVFEKLI
jgi:hypothetical protein